MDRKELLEWLSIIVVILGLLSTFIQALIQALSAPQAALVMFGAMTQILANGRPKQHATR